MISCTTKHGSAPYHTSTQDAEASGSGSQGQVGNTVRPCLKKMEEKEEEEEEEVEAGRD
jgi:hypothetical protein